MRFVSADVLTTIAICATSPYGSFVDARGSGVSSSTMVTIHDAESNQKCTQNIEQGV